MREAFYFFLLILITGLLASGCRSTQQLKVHRSSLKELAYSDATPAEKFDGMAEVIANVLDESTNFSSPIRTYRYLDKFSRQNSQSLDLLTDEIEKWQASLPLGQKLKFTSSAMTKPYSRKLLTLVPKVTRMMAANEYKLSKLERTLVLFKLKRMLKKK